MSTGTLRPHLARYLAAAPRGGIRTRAATAFAVAGDAAGFAFRRHEGARFLHKLLVGRTIRLVKEGIAAVLF
jgi:hypothetical protein